MPTRLDRSAVIDVASLVLGLAIEVLNAIGTLPRSADANRGRSIDQLAGGQSQHAVRTLCRVLQPAFHHHVILTRKAHSSFQLRHLPGGHRGLRPAPLTSC